MVENLTVMAKNSTVMAKNSTVLAKYSIVFANISIKSTKNLSVFTEIHQKRLKTH